MEGLDKIGLVDFKQDDRPLLGFLICRFGVMELKKENKMVISLA